MNQHRSLRWLGLAAASALALVACGGDDDDAAPATDPGPVTTEPGPPGTTVADSEPDTPPGTEGTTAPDTGAPTTAGAPVETTSLQVGISVDEPALMNLYVGLDEGIFERNGLDVELIATMQGNAAILHSGSIQFLVGPPGTITGQLEGAEITAIGRSAVTNQFIFATAESGITTVAELAGNSIGLSAPGGTADLQTHRAIELAGIDVDDVDLEYIGAQSAILEAAKSGQIQAGYVAGAAAKEAEGFGATLIASRDEGLDYDLLSYSIGVNDAFAADHPDVARAFLKAISEANQLVLDDRAVAEAALVGHLGLTPEDATEQYDLYIGGFTADVSLPEDYVIRLLEFAGQTDVDPADFYTDEYLP